MTTPQNELFEGNAIFSIPADMRHFIIHRPSLSLALFGMLSSLYYGKSHGSIKLAKQAFLLKLDANNSVCDNFRGLTFVLLYTLAQ